MSNPMYTNRAQMFLRSDIALFITDDPVTFTVEYAGTVDKVKGNTAPVVVGPYTGTVAEFRLSRSYPTFDEKGTVGRHPYVLLALDIPAGTFKLERTVVIGNQRFKISDPVITPDGVNEIGMELEVPGGG
jgi:hypothetical protein